MRPILLIFLFIVSQAFAAPEGRLAKNQYELLARMILSGEPFKPRNMTKAEALQTVFQNNRADILNGISLNNSLEPSHQFPFINNNEGMGDISEVNFGFCSGIVGFVRDVSLLAIFDPMGDVEPIPAYNYGSEEWVSFYTGKIESIKRGVVTVIPGFLNFTDMLEHSKIIRTVKEIIAWEWARKAAQLGSLETFLNFREATPEHAAQFKKDLLKVLGVGIKPKIWFKSKFNVRGSLSSGSYFDGLAYIHVLQVFEVNEHANGDYDLKMWDVNAPTHDAVQLLRISKNGLGYYERWKDISEGVISYYDIETGEEWEWAKYVHAWEKRVDATIFAQEF